MEQYYDLIKLNKLFAGFSDDEIELVFRNFTYNICEYSDGDKIIEFNQPEKFSFFMLCGNARIEKYDYDGAREILGIIPQGAVGRLLLDASENAGARASVVSSKKSIVLFMKYEDFIKQDYRLFPVQNKLMRNLITLLCESSDRNFEYEMILSERTTRKKIIRILKYFSRLNNSREFNLGYTRSELADCLCVDKSALSRELGNMKKEGIIDYSGNHFVLLRDLNNL